MGDLRKIFNPQTIALIGATERENSVARTVMENLLLSRDRALFPVNPGRKAILGLTCYPTVGDIPDHVDLAIIVTRADRVPGYVEACGRAGVDGVIIASAGFGEVGAAGKALEGRIIAAQKKYGLRIIGPNSMGLIRPQVNLNTTNVHAKLEKGRIAFVSQSEAFGRTLLDWGIGAHMGFSMFASLGSMIDVDFGDLIDFLGEDPQTRNIMIYVEESLGAVKKFMSAAKGVARNKPIIVLKPGAPAGAPKHGQTVTGMLADTELVYDAAFRRAGVVRVGSAADLFNTAGALSARQLPKGPRLLTITNAGGIDIMVRNTLLNYGGEQASLASETVKGLDALLPPNWQRGNAVDILRDADVERFIAALKICLQDSGVDGLLIIYTPQGIAAPEELAAAVADLAKNAWKPVVAVWMGGREVQKGREILLQNCIPTYRTPEEGVRTYLYMYSYRRNLDLLYETPAELSIDHAPPSKNLKAFVRKTVKEGVNVLTEAESMRFLKNYGIPVIKAQTTGSVEDAVQAAAEIGYPVVLKVSSPDIIFRSEAGGVVTGITSEQELRAEYAKLMAKLPQSCPGARINGLIVQKMLEKIDYEVIIGAKKDPLFGSVILFGMGGTAAELFNDFSIGLPPLNQTLARRLMEETKVYKMLKGYRNRPPADLRQLEQIMVSFANLIVDFPEIMEADINPLAVAHGQAYALDSRIVLDKNCLDSESSYPHLVITPYPSRYIMPWTMAGGKTLVLRPIKPEDAPLIEEMYATISDQAFHGRFFQGKGEMSPGMYIRQCTVDYDREIGIVAEAQGSGRKRIVGIGMLTAEFSRQNGEFAILVHDSYQGQGLGYKLVDMLIGIAQEKGLEEIFGYVLQINQKMHGICKMLGFTWEGLPEGLSKVKLKLQ